jgi:flagellar basal-body rod modification protein FlgD
MSDISAIDPSTAAAATQAATKSLTGNQQINQQQFLTLFIEQLKNQDPLSPLQPDQLTAQLAQFSSLEQLTGVNTRLDALNAATKQTTSSALLGLLGREVGVDGGQLSIKGGKVPKSTYTLTDPADRVTATVRDADGAEVRVIDLGAQGAGTHTFTFDGTGDDGQMLADGTYKLEINALAPGAQAPQPVTSLSTLAMVDGVDLSGDTPTLTVGGVQIPFDQVHEVQNP